MLQQTSKQLKFFIFLIVGVVVLAGFCFEAMVLPLYGLGVVTLGLGLTVMWARGYLPTSFMWVCIVGLGVGAVSTVASVVWSTDHVVRLLTSLMRLGSVAAVLGGMLQVIASRYGHSVEGLAGDASIVLVSGGLTTWVFAVGPQIINHGAALSAVGVAADLVGGVVISGALVAVYLCLVMLVSGQFDNIAVRSFGFAVVCVAAADTVRTLSDIGTLTAGWADVSISLYGVALLVAGFTFFSPHVTTLFAKKPLNSFHSGHTRFAVSAVAMMFPLGLVAVSPPSGDLDIGVRVAAISLLALAVTGRVGNAVKNTGRARRELLVASEVDALTGLGNRTNVTRILGEIVAAPPVADAQTVVVHVDIDRFKNLNDSLGYDVGDHILRVVADRLVEFFDAGTRFARVAGDEFIVIAQSDDNTTDWVSAANAMLACLAKPIIAQGHSVVVHASVGVVVVDDATIPSETEIFRYADIAKENAKRSGRNQVAVFDEDMYAEVATRLMVETRLPHAVDRDELVLYYQPILNLYDDSISGFEALLRWFPDGDKMVPPDQFIPVAEDSGDILQIGAWVLREGTRQLQEWIDARVVDPATTVSLNVSPRQLAQDGFVDTVREALSNSGLPPHLLWVEITETVMVSDPERTLIALNALQNLGVNIALDDFGTGYSSLSSVRQFPLQRLKIDRQFVNALEVSSYDDDLVRTIVAMGNTLGLEVLAEGVETERQLATLRSLGCERAQGYLIGRPMPPADVSGYLEPSSVV